MSVFCVWARGKPDFCVCALEGDVEPCEEGVHVWRKVRISIARTRKKGKETGRRTFVARGVEGEGRCERQVLFLRREEVYLLSVSHSSATVPGSPAIPQGKLGKK